MAKPTATAKVFSSVRIEAELYSKMVRIAEKERTSISQLWSEAAKMFTSNHPALKGE